MESHFLYLSQLGCELFFRGTSIGLDWGTQTAHWHASHAAAHHLLHQEWIHSSHSSHAAHAAHTSEACKRVWLGLRLRLRLSSALGC